jgi:hypothetical protein
MCLYSTPLNPYNCDNPMMITRPEETAPRRGAVSLHKTTNTPDPEERLNLVEASLRPRKTMVTVLKTR